MSKHTNHPRRKNDAYLTWDRRAVPPLLPRLEHYGVRTFVEPCAGRGDLVDWLEAAGLQCVSAFDTNPQRYDIEYGDANYQILPPCDTVISNFPWTREYLEAIICNMLSQGKMVWSLHDWDWLSNLNKETIIRPFLHEVVPIGRLRWVEGSAHDAKDSCAWYLFGPDAPKYPIVIPRG